jgi:hypothetical protein
MKALIFQNKVVDISETEFDVHSGMSWINCDDNVKIGFSYNGSSFVSDAPSSDEIAATKLQSLRQRRNQLLKETDHLALSDQTLSSSMSTYRQALRDITDSATSLDDVTWPEKPA